MFRLFHALNARAMANEGGRRKGIGRFKNSNIIVAQFRWGDHDLYVGKMERQLIFCSDDEGPFSPERSGTIAPSKLLGYVFDNEIPFKKGDKNDSR